ncbi:uncharacterized protein TRIREDRAFT_111863 [Trichoderma reesei QM6a]|jgi:hypothetical protein|uniref:Predicted protein n=2 Tax=Hypocrea jecorina TaxID=51453 RepID=G0RVL8_HYPJQ|nr:uncharacterized protein TRIREDRAFT_111863 [Trichoderma reesei QM6a]EGR44732.1 predicted protein [Trichoderma reesei QM6a]ETR97633.1 hypothetical protein M419DRAFT_12626 [Trichoderma reesei RUT C-30]
MSKRKLSDPLPPPKRARLTQPHDMLDSKPSLTKDARREKRKRSEPLSTNPHEGPKSKRPRTSAGSSDATTISLDISTEPWPSIEDVSEEEEVPTFTSEETAASRESSFDRWPSIPYEPKPSEEMDQEVLAFQIAGESAMAGYVCEYEYIDMLLQGTMPSPEPSDGDAGEREAFRHTIADEIIPPARRSTLKPRATPSPTLPKASPRRRRSVTPYRRTEKCSSLPSCEEEPQQQGRKDKKNNRRQRQKETPSPAMEKFLQSKRSSRRAPAGQLWCLDEKGRACDIQSSRR